MPLAPMAPVVVGVDRSGINLSAVDLAAEEAAARVTPLVLVHGHPAGDPRTAAEHDVLDLAVSRVLADHPWLAVTAKLLLGDPVRVLVAQSARASLLVVGHRRAVRPARSAGSAAGPVPGSAAGPTAGSVAGSVAAQVMRLSRCPVIAHLPEPSPPRTERAHPVLLGVTRRREADSVVEFAFEEAALRGAALCAVYVCPVRGGTARALDDALEAWSAKYPQVPVACRAWPGYDVVRALCDESREAQLVVVGAEPLAGRSRPMRGRLVEDLLDYAACPVAVVPHA